MTATDNAIITQTPRHVDLVFVDDDDFFVNNFIRFFLQNKIIDKYHTAQEF
jgi:hypothetical protein